MEFLDFKNILKKELINNKINENINYEKFYNFMNLLLDWNKIINLTAITNEEEFIVKHFVDSLTIARFIGNNDKIIDVGTGAGFPGIPLKIYNNNLNVTLIDSVNKKINVINDIIEKLELKSVNAIHTRAEDYAKNNENREKFDIAVSRAVSNMSTLVEYLLPFVKIKGKIICMKGPNYREELEEAKNAINILGGKLDYVETVKINDELERNIIIISKIKNTPNKYPRGQGKPLKEPIK